MIQSLLRLPENASPAQMCEALGNTLGLGKPAPIAALLRAIDDPEYATNLITCRNAPDFLDALFDDPQTRAYEFSDVHPEHSTAQLAGKALAALVRWGRAGFSTVDQDVLEQREAACLACPHLQEPQNTLQKLMPVGPVDDQLGRRLGARVCALCGCVLTKKIRLPTESCPDRDPNRVGLTRWGEQHE